MIEKKLSLFVLFTIFSLGVFAQQSETNKIANAFKTGSTTELSSHFMPSINLSIQSNEGIYSASQATQILKTFFSTNTPKNFVINHEGNSRNGDLFKIGVLSTTKGAYRVTFYLVKTKVKYSIKQLRIEPS